MLAQQTTHTNSSLTADNLNVVTTGDATIIGGNLHGATGVSMDIGGDLTLESVQDRFSGSSQGAGISGGTSFDANTGDVSSVSGGLNASSGRYQTTETVLSSITGGAVDISVDGHTQLTGALIAALDEDGNDTGQLNLSTGSLDFTDLSNRSYSSNQSIGVNANVGVSDAANPADPTQSTTDLALNSSTYSYQNESSQSLSSSLATIGEGSISVGGEDADPSGLNRDVDNLTNDIYAVDRQQGNIDLTVDHRLLSEEGREEIREQITQLPANLEAIASELVDGLEILLDPGADQRIAGNAEIMAMVREHLAGLSEEEQQELMQYVGVFIDGTGNNKYADMASGEETNVAILSELYQGTTDEPLYYEGVGTSWYSAIACGLTGCGGQIRVNEALHDIAAEWQGGDHILMIDVTGFSRGATQSVELINTIMKNGLPDVPQNKIVINGAYLFDTVSSTGIPGNQIDFGYNLTVPEVVPVFHAVANDEFRGLFGLQSQNYSDGTSPPNVTEQGFFGAHSDVGGGYAPGSQGKENTLSTIPLQWMHENATNNNSPLLPIPAHYQVPAELQQLYDAAASGDESARQTLNEKYIHDSRYPWERWQNRDSRPVYHPRGENPDG